MVKTTPSFLDTFCRNSVCEPSDLSTTVKRDVLNWRTKSAKKLNREHIVAAISINAGRAICTCRIKVRILRPQMTLRLHSQILQGHPVCLALNENIHVGCRYLSGASVAAKHETHRGQTQITGGIRHGACVVAYQLFDRELRLIKVVIVGLYFSLPTVSTRVYPQIKKLQSHPRLNRCGIENWRSALRTTTGPVFLSIQISVPSVATASKP